MQSVARILDPIAMTMDTTNVADGRRTGIWTHLIDIFAGVLLADT